MNELNQLKYRNRMVRLEKLIALRAPPWLIANECALVVGAVYDILEPLNLIREHAGPDAPPTTETEYPDLRLVPPSETGPVPE